MKIGDKTLKLRKRPSDIEAQLLASTGCSEAEVAAWLRGNPLPGLVAAALLPFVEGGDAPAIPELADAIATAGVAGVAAEVAKLYDAAKPEIQKGVE